MKRYECPECGSKLSIHRRRPLSLRCGKCQKFIQPEKADYWEDGVLHSPTNSKNYKFQKKLWMDKVDKLIQAGMDPEKIPNMFASVEEKE